MITVLTLKLQYCAIVDVRAAPDLLLVLAMCAREMHWGIISYLQEWSKTPLMQAQGC